MDSCREGVQRRDSEVLDHIIIQDVGLMQAFIDITAAYLKACKMARLTGFTGECVCVCKVTT